MTWTGPSGREEKAEGVRRAASVAALVMTLVRYSGVRVSD